MYPYISIILILVCGCAAQIVYESDVNFRVEPGSRTCFFEKGKAGQVMEAQYQVIDGQHGELDISFEIIGPTGEQLLTDYKKQQNSIIIDLSSDGEYVFCLDNTYSMMNSKLVFVYVLIEDRAVDIDNDTVVSIEEENGEKIEEEILEWTGTDENGNVYYIEVEKISASLSRTLAHVLKARHYLDLYGADKSRDSYIAREDTFIVDLWSGFQITFMTFVGFIQVYMIKNMFSRSCVEY